MFFGNNQIDKKPVGYHINWAVEYKNNTIRTEFDQNNKKRNFYDIARKLIHKFGFYNEQGELYYEQDTGDFYIGGKKISIVYVTDRGEKLKVTSPSDNKELIMYKESSFDVNIGKVSGEARPSLDSVNFGYKHKLLDNHIQVIAKMPTNAPLYFTVRISSELGLNGTLLFLCNDKVVESFEAPVKAGRAGEINWNLV